MKAVVEQVAGIVSASPMAEVRTRIAVGGFLHETNTFAPTKATYDAFVHGGGWPSMVQAAAAAFRDTREAVVGP